MVKRFILMLQFMTTIPIKTRIDANAEDYGKGLVFAPLVGLVIGVLLALICRGLLLIFPSLLTAVLIAITYIMLTGGLHLDGLGDTFDGIFSNRPKEKILEIMRDSCHGTNALLAVSSIIVLYIAVIYSIIDQGTALKALLLMPVAGRIGSLIGAGVSEYARSGEGMGKAFTDYCSNKEILTGLPFYAVLFYIIAGFNGLIMITFSSLSAFFLVKYFGRKIGGTTGDILGAVCELNQALFLILWYIIYNF